MDDTTIAATFARAVLEFAVSKGGNRDLLLERSGLDPAQLQDDDERVAFASYATLLRAGGESCGDPAFALHFGESGEGLDSSFACMTDAVSRTMAEGLGQPQPASPERFRLERDGDDLWVIDTRDTSGCREVTEASFARSFCMSRRLLPGRELIKAVRFTHSEPSYRAEYDRIFRTAIEFESDCNAVLMASSWMNERQEGPSRYVLAMMKARVESVLDRTEHSNSMRRRVESQLESLLRSGDVGVDTVARKLGLSRHTLFRRLRAEGATFEKVLDELRHRLALDYLTGKNASVNETAYLLGFSDPTAFSRAFKRWTGRSPSAITEHAAHPRT